MSSESVCQVAHSWMDVDSFHTRLFGVVYVACGDFHDGSEKVTASVHQILFQSWDKWYRWDRCLHAGGNCFEGDGGR